MSHTAGDWRYRRERWPSSPAWLIEAELPCINGLKAWFPVAHVYIEPDAIKMSDGNLSPENDARLIAAAPHMLRALKAAKGHLEEMREDREWRPIGDCPVLREVCAAILAAEAYGG